MLCPTGDPAFDGLTVCYRPADGVLAAFDSELRQAIGTAVSAFGGSPAQWEGFGRDGGISIVIQPDRITVTVRKAVSTDLARDRATSRATSRAPGRAKPERGSGAMAFTSTNEAESLAQVGSNPGGVRRNDDGVTW